MRKLRHLHELIAALDRRVPQVERLGEIAIAREGRALREKALQRIAKLEASLERTASGWTFSTITTAVSRDGQLAIDGLMPGAEEGPTAAEAARRLAVYGPNEAAPVRRLSAVVQLFRVLTNPLVIILLVASAIVASLGQQVDAGSSRSAVDEESEWACAKGDSLAVLVKIIASQRDHRVW